MPKYLTCRKMVEVARFEEKMCLEPTVDGEFCATHVPGARLEANWKDGLYVGPAFWPTADEAVTA